MIQIQSKWKLGALLLAAPMLMPLAAQAKDYEQTSQTADGAVFRLKSGYKWTGPQGEVYLFREDGQFEYRGPEVTGYTYSKDFGRFTVRKPKASDQPYIDGEKLMLDLKITSSLRRPDKKGGKSKVVQRVAQRTLGMKVYSNRPDNDDKYDPKYNFVLSGVGRFTQPSNYMKR